MAAHATHPQAENWLRDLGVRCRRYTAIKFVGISGVMTGFFLSYFWLLNHPRSAPTTVPIIFLDHWVPFWPLALPVYVSLWLYVLIPPVLLRVPPELTSYTVTTVLLSCAGFVVFYFWPTAVPPLIVDSETMPTLAHLKIVDATGNAFPSLHVAFAVYTALWLRRQGRELGAPRWLGVANWVWCGAIVVSTVAIRQHVALDAVAGALLGAGFAVGQHLRLDRRLARSAPTPSAGR